MSNNEVYIVQRVDPVNEPIVFDEKICNGCNTCVEACMMDVLAPNPEEGKPPIVLHPDECWFGGCCVKECPLRDKGAINMKWPMKTKIQLRWKRKETGEHFRLGMLNPPPPNTRPPVGGWDAKA
jgi:NAD-dependent dihydropyrimidine dehydrogenase PreA subunit